MIQRSILIVLSWVCVLFLAGCSHLPAKWTQSGWGASDEQTVHWTQAKSSYQQGDIATVVRHLKPLAKAGDAKAQYALGYFYYYGKGVSVNRPKARKLFHQAAQQGEPRAIEALKRIQQSGLFSIR